MKFFSSFYFKTSFRLLYTSNRSFSFTNCTEGTYSTFFVVQKWEVLYRIILSEKCPSSRNDFPKAFKYFQRLHTDALSSYAFSLHFTWCFRFSPQHHNSIRPRVCNSIHKFQQLLKLFSSNIYLTNSTVKSKWLLNYQNYTHKKQSVDRLLCDVGTPCV